MTVVPPLGSPETPEELARRLIAFYETHSWASLNGGCHVPDQISSDKRLYNLIDAIRLLCGGEYKSPVAKQMDSIAEIIICGDYAKSKFTPFDICKWDDAGPGGRDWWEVIGVLARIADGRHSFWQERHDKLKEEERRAKEYCDRRMEDWRRENGLSSPFRYWLRHLLSKFVESLKCNTGVL